MVSITMQSLLQCLLERFAAKFARVSEPLVDPCLFPQVCSVSESGLIFNLNSLQFQQAAGL